MLYVLLWTRTKIKSHMAFLLAKPTPHNVNHDNDRFSMFNKKRDIPPASAPWATWPKAEAARGGHRRPTVPPQS
jgi:hypothetical protein